MIRKPQQLVALLAFGRASDTVGRRPVLLAALSVAALSSLVFLVVGGLTADSSKDILERFAALGFETDPGTPEALAQRSKAETAKWAKAIKDAKIEPQ